MSDDKIDLRSSDEPLEPLFRVDHLADDIELTEASDLDVVSESDAKSMFSKADTKIKIKFEKFVNLVATHAYEDLFAKYKDEDVVVGADLLTDLANAHGDKDEKSVSGIFIFGAIIGAIAVWFLLK